MVCQICNFCLEMIRTLLASGCDWLLLYLEYGCILQIVLKRTSSPASNLKNSGGSGLDLQFTEVSTSYWRGAYEWMDYAGFFFFFHLFCFSCLFWDNTFINLGVIHFSLRKNWRKENKKWTKHKTIPFHIIKIKNTLK